MSKNKYDGGSAFPGIAGEYGHGNCTRHITGDTQSFVEHNQGMSLRAYLAGQALAGLCANPDYTSLDPDVIANTATKAADALIVSLNND